ncbi:MAG: YggT family protein [Mucispirillum sp.]|nr:YggT family protein [Mucispirillum sp.]
MSFVILLAKIYIVILLFRFVATKQELMFNPVGKIVAAATDPIMPKKRAANIIPLYIFLLVIVTSLLNSLASDIMIFGYKLIYSVMDYLEFFMLLFIVSMILGSFGNRPIGGGFVAYFFRLGLPWVRLTRVFIPINSGKIIFPAIIFVFLIYVSVSFLLAVVYKVIAFKDMGNVLTLLLFPVTHGARAVFGLMFYMSFLILVRALISWVSPDPRNIIVQLLYTVTEPILEPLRKIIPPIGFLDVSALVAMIALNLCGQLLRNLVPLVNL